MNARELLDRVAAARDDQDLWCTLDKAETLALIVRALRPLNVVEIGVWRGASLIPMLIALRANQRGRAIAIDPWAASASVEGQTELNAKWWGGVDHEQIFREFLARVDRLELRDHLVIERQRSTVAAVFDHIGVLHIDGNHGETAIADVKRFAPAVVAGGILVLDDVDWSGAFVAHAHAIAAQDLGFVDLYPLDKGIVMQRTRS